MLFYIFCYLDEDQHGLVHHNPALCLASFTLFKRNCLMSPHTLCANERLHSLIIAYPGIEHVLQSISDLDWGGRLSEISSPYLAEISGSISSFRVRGFRITRGSKETH